MTVTVNLHNVLARVAEQDWLHRVYTIPDHRLAWVIGPAGSGKTTLAQMFAVDERGLFPGGVARCSAAIRDIDTPSSLLALHLPERHNERQLLGIDDTQLLGARAMPLAIALLAMRPNLCLLLLSDRDLPGTLDSTPVLHLHFPDASEFASIVQCNLRGFTPEIGSTLHALTQGNLHSLRAILNSLLKDNVSARAIRKLLSPLKAVGVLGPDGKPASLTLGRREPVIAAVSDVNNELIERLARRPEELRSLPPRHFEQVAADILTRLGFQVELTPQSRDGGFDMYAARKDGVGEFLYLVECKRFSPPHHVGVQVVRALHGVVERHRATAGIVLTTSFFTRDAIEFRNDVKHRLSLADFIELRQWLVKAALARK